MNTHIRGKVVRVNCLPFASHPPNLFQSLLPWHGLPLQPSSFHPLYLVTQSYLFLNGLLSLESPPWQSSSRKILLILEHPAQASLLLCSLPRPFPRHSRSTIFVYTAGSVFHTVPSSPVLPDLPKGEISCLRAKIGSYCPLYHPQRWFQWDTHDKCSIITRWMYEWVPCHTEFCSITRMCLRVEMWANDIAIPPLPGVDDFLKYYLSNF